MHSLKSRLIIGMIGGMLLLFIAFDLIVYNSIKASITRQFDDSLKSQADLICSAVEWSVDELDFEVDTLKIADHENEFGFVFHEVRDTGGNVIFESDYVNKDEITGFYSNATPCEFKTIVTKNDGCLRAVAVRFLPRVEKDSENETAAAPVLILTLAKRYDNVLTQLSWLKKLFFAASAVIIVFSCAIAILIVNQSLSPLTSVAAQIEAIDQENLSKRICGDHLPSELSLIKTKINELLHRLQTSFDREKTFNGNVAHELRTPIAGIRMIIEVALSKNRDAAEYQKSLSELLPIVDGMQDMSQKLLMLTRLESQKVAINPVRLDLRQIIDKCWSSLSGRATEAGIAFENLLGTDEFHSDHACISIIFSNLLDNAVSHVNKGGRIRVISRKKNEEFEITIENTGNNVATEHIDKVFDLYWRGDESRHSSGDAHFGLGLPLVKRMVQLLGGRIRAHAAADLFCITVCLPAKKDFSAETSF